jgi:hypothetical protein
VNNENEPVDGTSPDNLLFDRSLQINRNILLIRGFLVMPRKMTWKTRKANTYRTWRAVIAVNDLGIVPERLLLLRRLSS